MAQLEKIGSLWAKKATKSGVEYLSGIINGEKIVVFKNNRKDKPTQPDWLIYPQQSRDEVPPKEDEDSIPF